MRQVAIRILCCYTELREETRLSLQEYETEFVHTGGDEFAYWRAIADRWSGRSPLMVVEGDMVVPRGAPESFARCEKAWCTYAYTVNQGGYIRAAERVRLAYDALGIAKFSAGAQLDVPFVGRTGWRRLDVTVRDYFTAVVNPRLPPGQYVYPHVHGVARHLRYSEADDLVLHPYGMTRS